MKFLRGFLHGGQLQEKADHSSVRGVSSNKEGNLHRRLVLGGYKMDRSSYLPARILKIYIEA